MIIYCISAIVIFVGAIGLFRFPDVYTRIHAATLITISGIILPLIALAIENKTYTIKIIIIILLMLLSNATTGHAIGKSAHRHGIKPKNLIKNDLVIKK
ncbi:Na+/H+ antiporter subunit G [archaeon]|nr:Na+/H+ antiporter subunit G [archaeon]